MPNTVYTHESTVLADPTQIAYSSCRLYFLVMYFIQPKRTPVYRNLKGKKGSGSENCQRGLTEEMPENAHVCIQEASTHSH